MAITTAAQAITEINATNLVDGQQIKQLLADLSTWIGTIAASEGAIITPQAGPAELTDSSTGTASSILAPVVNAVAATTDTSAAQLVSVNAALLVIKNAVASNNAQTNALITKLVASGVLTST